MEFSSKRIVEIGRELAAIEERKQALLAELQELVELGSIPASAPGSANFDRRVREMRSKIRSLLDSRPSRCFRADEIKSMLLIPPTQDKTFYSALIKLSKRKEIRRVGRATYKHFDPSEPEPILEGKERSDPRP